MSDLIGQIQDDRDDTDIEGYAGVAVDTGSRALDVWWVGTPPDRVTQLVAAPPHDLVIRLHAASYDYATSDRAIGRLMDRYPALHSGSPEGDGSGIRVETTAEGKRTVPGPAELTEQAKMPVRILVTEPPEAA